MPERIITKIELNTMANIIVFFFLFVHSDTSVSVYPEAHSLGFKEQVYENPGLLPGP
jgi:hypothetical protein